MSQRTVNSVTILGNLGKDAETAFTQGGVALTKFSIATERRWKTKSGEDKSETDWVSCVAWRKEKVAEYMLKGTTVYCEGRIQTRSYDDSNGVKKYVTEVVVDEIILLGGGKDKEKAKAAAPGSGKSTQMPYDDDDSIPF